MLKKAGYLACAAVGGIALLLSVGLMALPARPQSTSQNETPASTYLLQETEGYLALFDESGKKLASWPIFTALLPPADAQALREGIAVSTQQELQSLLEDYGL